MNVTGPDKILKHMIKRPISLDRVFHALADGTRREILDRLGHGPATVSELAEPFAMSLAAVLQHLKLLEESGLIRSEKIGRVRTCRVDAEGLERAEAWMERQRRIWSANLDRLGDLLAEDDETP